MERGVGGNAEETGTAADGGAAKSAQPSGAGDQLSGRLGIVVDGKVTPVLRIDDGGAMLAPSEGETRASVFITSMASSRWRRGRSTSIRTCRLSAAARCATAFARTSRS